MYNLFEQKYKECEKSLYLVALGYLHNTEDARDCLQEAAISAFKNYGTLKNDSFFKTWITRIVINKAKDFIKKKRYSDEFDDNLNLFYEIPEKNIELLNAISKLKPKQSVYITLKFYNGMTYDEMAKLLKQPVSTVKYRTKLALGELKKFLEEDFK